MKIQWVLEKASFLYKYSVFSAWTSIVEACFCHLIFVCKLERRKKILPFCTIESRTVPKCYKMRGFKAYIQAFYDLHRLEVIVRDTGCQSLNIIYLIAIWKGQNYAKMQHRFFHDKHCLMKAKIKKFVFERLHWQPWLLMQRFLWRQFISAGHNPTHKVLAN